MPSTLDQHRNEQLRLAELRQRDLSLAFMRAYAALHRVAFSNVRLTENGITCVLVKEKSEHPFSIDMKPLAKLDADILALALISAVQEALKPAPEPEAPATP